MTALTLVGLLALLAVHAGVQGRRVSQAAKTRDVEQARHDDLQLRRRQLQPFRELADGIVGRERLLATAMQTQVSWSAVLTSLGRNFPPDASLTSLTAESTLPPFAAGPPAVPGNEQAVIGSTKLQGYSTRTFTPGVQGMLQVLGGVTGLAEPRLDVGTANRIGGVSVTMFDGTTFVDGAALSGRYAGGLPPEDDVEVPRLPRPATASTGGSEGAPR